MGRLWWGGGYAVQLRLSLLGEFIQCILLLLLLFPSSPHFHPHLLLIVTFFTLLLAILLPIHPPPSTPHLLPHCSLPSFSCVRVALYRVFSPRTLYPLLCDIDMILIRWILWVYTWLPCVCMCTCGPLLVSWCVVYPSVRHVWVFGRSDFHGWHSQLAPGHSKHRSFSARIWVITHHRCPWSRSSWQPH